MSIEFQRLYEEAYGALFGVYAKGHHEPAAFVKAMVDQEDETCRLSDVRHIYARLVPAKYHDDLRLLFCECEPGRGAFAATYVDGENVRFIGDPCDDCGVAHSGLEPCAARGDAL